VISETIEPVANAPPATAVVFRNLRRFISGLRRA
jgi:hypothetical protein